jgi:hypothetical protein
MTYTGSSDENKHFHGPQSSTLEQIAEYNKMVLDNNVPCILPPCPRCVVSSDQFCRHELRKRQFHVIIDEVVHVEQGVIIRWKCPGCDKTFSQYPHFALPHKRYTLADIMAYAKRYLGDEKITYSRLLKIWAAGYERQENDEAQLWPSTVHRWITTLGNCPQILRKALALIHQKDLSTGLTRTLAQLKVSSRKFLTEARRKALLGCLQLLFVEAIYRRIFAVSIYPKLAAACAYG